MLGLSEPIVSERLSLVVMTPDVLGSMQGERDEVRPFAWPAWWPDEVDRGHLAMWTSRSVKAEPNIAWGPRAVIDAEGQMLGHAGFHLPPRPIERALDDPTFVGRRDPVAGVALSSSATRSFRSIGIAGSQPRQSGPRELGTRHRRGRSSPGRRRIRQHPVGTCPRTRRRVH